MGSEDLFKKRREERKRTEPLYFKGIQKKIKEKMDGRIDVVEIPVIDIHGGGCGTGKLIDLTERIVRDAKIFYQNIWVMFDKDDFKDFDEAICLGKDKGYKVAWSNQSFEYWLYLHFHYSDSALHRHDWNEKLSEVFK